MTAARATAGALIAAFGALSCAAGGVSTHWKEIRRPPLAAFEPQQPRRLELPNGLVVLLQEDHELPLIGGSALIRGGSREEPADKLGLVEIYGEVWRTGGTKNKSGDELDDFLEARAAKVETMGGHANSVITFSCLKGDLDDVFGLFVELLREPAFREEKMAIARAQLFTAIARRNDSPGSIATRESTKLAYGADSPYARVSEYKTVKAVSREDLVGWHQATVHPNNILLGISGDFDSAAMEARLRKAFEAWPRGPVRPKQEARIEEPKPGVYFVEKDDVNQSTIRMVHLGTTKDNPDYHALEVMNYILGGSFTSRLFSSLRTKKGLAYQVGGGVGTAFDHPGVFRLVMGTKSGSTAAAIAGLLEELDGLKTSPPTRAELAIAKDALLNSFIFRFDSRAKILGERLILEFYGYPADFLERYRAGVEKVTIEDVTRVSRKWVHKEKLRILVVGKSKDFDKPLSTFGPVTPVDITIPPG